LGTIILYTISVFLYWYFWWRKSEADEFAQVEIAEEIT
jgi:hypothetical protein